MYMYILYGMMVRNEMKWKNWYSSWALNLILLIIIMIIYLLELKKPILLLFEWKYVGEICKCSCIICEIFFFIFFELLESCINLKCTYNTFTIFSYMVEKF